MCFSLEQSSDRKAILRNLLKTHMPFLTRRPADAKEYYIPGTLRAPSYPGQVGFSLAPAGG